MITSNNLLMGCIYAILCKVVGTCTLDIHINTTIKVVNGPTCISHVKSFCYSLVQTLRKVFYGKIL
jgi:hypothetical protein